MKVFTSENCSNCKMLYPQLEGLDVEYISIDTDEGVLEAMAYGVGAVPTMVFNDNYTVIGFKPRSWILSVMKEHENNEKD